MFVSYTDKWIYDGNFEETQLTDNYWYLKYLKKKERIFAVYYFNMKSLIDDHGLAFFVEAFRDHTGLTWNRHKIKSLVKLFKSLEERVDKAKKNSDLKTLSEIKLGINHERR